ncbi:MAG: hypothetical protein AAB110_05360, partial [Candidatus Desantisbacteria bacterium]
MNKNPIRLLYLLCITFICIFSFFNIANAVDNSADLGGFSSLRNDEKNLLKPMGASVETTKTPVRTTKETHLVKPAAEKAEKEDVSESEKAEKIEGETSGLKTTFESKEILVSP